MTAKVVRLITLDFLVLYLMFRLPIPLLVIPMMGCMVIFNVNQIKEIKNEKKKAIRKRHKKINRKQS